MLNENKKENLKIEALYHISKLLSILEELTDKDLNDIAKNPVIKKVGLDTKEKLDLVFKIKKDVFDGYTRHDSLIEQYYFVNVISKLRNIIVHNRFMPEENLEQLGWIIKVLLSSKSKFETINELINFLSNITGIVFDEGECQELKIQSVVEWYFERISELNQGTKNKIYLDLLNFLLVSSDSNYREWKNILHKEE